MCDTVLRRQSYSGEQLNKFLERALEPSAKNRQPKLTVGTIQRLLGHVDVPLVSAEILDRLFEAQDLPEGDQPIDKLVAPTFRSIEDFRGCSEIVIRVASGAANGKLWQPFPNPLLDESTGKISVKIDDVTRVDLDPRSPTVWTAYEYRLLHPESRPKPGRGGYDRIAEVANASIRLSAFSSHPRIPERYISGALRNFVLMGK